MHEQVHKGAQVVHIEHHGQTKVYTQTTYKER